MKISPFLVFYAAMFFNVASAQNEMPPPSPPSELEPHDPSPPIDYNTTPSSYDGPAGVEIGTDYNLPSEKIFEMFDVEKEPSLPGGRNALFKFISDSLQYPVQAKEMSIGGQVILTFVVDTTGNLLDIKIIKDLGGGCGREATRVIKSMPLWIPGEVKGQKVKVRYTLPVRFRLND